MSEVLDFERTAEDFFRGLNKPAADPAPAPSFAKAPADASPATAADDEKAAAFDRLSFFPKPDDDYRANPLPVPGSVPMLTLLLKDGRRPTFSYGDLRFIDILPPKKPSGGPGLLLRFFGVGKAELEGSHLDRLHGLIFLHRLAWIRECPDGKAGQDDNAVVITAMTVTLLEA